MKYKMELFSYLLFAQLSEAFVSSNSLYPDSNCWIKLMAPGLLPNHMQVKSVNE